MTQEIDNTIKINTYNATAIGRAPVSVRANVSASRETLPKLNDETFNEERWESLGQC
jgi:hypothetical protein